MTLELKPYKTLYDPCPKCGLGDNDATSPLNFRPFATYGGDPTGTPTRWLLEYIEAEVGEYIEHLSVQCGFCGYPFSVHLKG